MEHLGSHYGVILNDPELRTRLIADAERSQRSAARLRASVRLRLQLAGVLRKLAERLGPQQTRRRETSSSQPLFER